MDQEYATKVASRFGDRLKELRAAAGLTQAALGKLCGVPQSSIADYELDKTTATWPQVIKLAHALGVTPDAFIREPESGGKNSDKKNRNAD